MIEFYQTVMGRRFIEGDVPRLVSGVERLNKNLERIATALEQLIAQKASPGEGVDLSMQLSKPLDPSHPGKL